MNKGWIGVDLDGTLAFYDGWHGPAHIGAPVASMVRMVQTMLDRGDDVRIFTARAGDPEAVEAVEQWCIAHIGRKLPVTNVKDYDCIAFYDDRAIPVARNLGLLIRVRRAEPEREGDPDLWFE